MDALSDFLAAVVLAAVLVVLALALAGGMLVAGYRAFARWMLGR
jgi:hypothetical protein